MSGEAAADTRALFERLERIARERIGEAVFTANRFVPETVEVERVYSSEPVAYPVGSRKKKLDTEFARRILFGGQMSVCEGDAQVAAMFDDHELIRSLGMHSVLNAPVLSNGACVGVINLTMPADHVTKAQIEAARDLALTPEVVAYFQALAE